MSGHVLPVLVSETTGYTVQSEHKTPTARDAIDTLVDMLDARDDGAFKTTGLMKTGALQALYEVVDPYSIDIPRLRQALGLPPK